MGTADSWITPNLPHHFSLSFPQVNSRQDPSKCRLKIQQMTGEECTDGAAFSAPATAKASENAWACFCCRQGLPKPSWQDQKTWTGLFPVDPIEGSSGYWASNETFRNTWGNRQSLSWSWQSRHRIRKGRIWPRIPLWEPSLHVVEDTGSSQGQPSAATEWWEGETVTYTHEQNETPLQHLSSRVTRSH